MTSYRTGRALPAASLVRVADEGAMRVLVERGTVTDVRLDIYEPPTFFESFLRGRAHTEPPDITARICGICPAAYQVSACNAIEDVCGARLDGQIAALRRLLYCGEWIASHAMHIHLMHAPDFLGYDGVVEMARDHRAVVERGLAIKRAGTALLEAVGGRALHPDNVRIGGFHRAPDPVVLRELADESLRGALDDAVETAAWVAGFEYPDFTHDHELLSLVDEGRYPIERGTPRTSGGLRFPVSSFEEHLVEGARYLTGPSARYGLNARWLSPLAAEAAAAADLDRTYRNPFRSIVVRAVETIYALEEALSIIEAYEPPPRPFVDVPARAGTGYGASEAPRGTLFNRYTLAPDGTVLSARILPPTAQNQASIADDLRRFVQERLDLDERDLTFACERAIRNYDPCISCATHFLDLKVVRS